MKYLTLLLLLVSPVLALDLEDYKVNGASDDAALAAAIVDAKSGSDPEIYFYGSLTLRQPPPYLDRVHLIGRDIYGATVTKAYPGGVLFRFDGRPGYSGGGLHNFSIMAAPGNAGSYAILARSKPGYGPHGLQLEDLYIGAGFYRAIEIAGHDNPNVPGQLGVRQVRVNNVTVFGTTAPASVYLHWTSDARLEALRLYPAGGVYGDLNAVPANNPGLVVAP